MAKETDDLERFFECIVLVTKMKKDKSLSEQVYSLFGSKGYVDDYIVSLGKLYQDKNMMKVVRDKILAEITLVEIKDFNENVKEKYPEHFEKDDNEDYNSLLNK